MEQPKRKADCQQKHLSLLHRQPEAQDMREPERSASSVRFAPAILGLGFLALLYSLSYFNGSILLEEIQKSGFLVSGLLLLRTLDAGKTE